MNILDITQTITFKGAPDEGPDVNALYILQVFKGDIIDVMSDDGPSDDYKCEVHLLDGLTLKPLYVLDRVFIGSVVTLGEDYDCYMKSADKAERIISKIETKGVIDLDYWHKIAA